MFYINSISLSNNIRLENSSRLMLKDAAQNDCVRQADAWEWDRLFCAVLGFRGRPAYCRQDVLFLNLVCT